MLQPRSVQHRDVLVGAARAARETVPAPPLDKTSQRRCNDHREDRLRRRRRSRDDAAEESRTRGQKLHQHFVLEHALRSSQARPRCAARDAHVRAQLAGGTAAPELAAHLRRKRLRRRIQAGASAQGPLAHFVCSRGAPTCATDQRQRGEGALRTPRGPSLRFRGPYAGYPRFTLIYQRIPRQSLASARDVTEEEKGHKRNWH